MSPARYRDARVGGCLSAHIAHRPAGEIVLRSVEPLGEFPHRLSDRLEHWAHIYPDRILAAQRDPSVIGGGDWLSLTYAEMLVRAKAVGQALLERGASVERPLAILSGNDLEHLTLTMGAMWAGVPWVPISPAYSLLSSDYAKLRHIFAVTTPAVVYASDPSYAAAIAAVVPVERPDIHVVLGTGALPKGAAIPFRDLLSSVPGPSLETAHARTGPDTIVKFLFTSGSTKQPKGVVNTQRMWCANLQMQAQCMGFLADEAPVLVDWLPWNHTFGGNQNVGLVLYNGGTLYIDEGKPTPQGIAQTIRNLREIAPTVYFNVPKGFEELSRAMEQDEVLKRSLFSRVKTFMFAGAGLSQSTWDRLERQAESAVGERIRIVTGLGMTETAPSCLFVVQPGAGAGHVGLPCPGVEVKLVPNAEGSGKTEIRFRGPNVMPGYWRAPDLTADAFDDEGFYRTGDAVRWIDDKEPQRGLAFDGRIGEDFKLSTGTFVSVGPLRARIIAEGDPLIQDVVVAGLNRDDIGLLVFPRIDELRGRFESLASLPTPDLLAQHEVRALFQTILDRLWAAGTGSANRPARALLLTVPPQIDQGELTDKGSINQRIVLTRRSALVEQMYQDHDDVLRPSRS